MNFQVLLSNKRYLRNALIILFCIVMGLISFFPLAKKASDPLTYQKTIQSLDEKKQTISMITASSAAASSAIAAIPGDATTPIANQIIEISSYLLIVVCALVLEKSLLTTLGFISFKFLIPLVCIFIVIYVLSNAKSFRSWAIKIGILALMLTTIVPLSQKVSDLIYNANKEIVEQVTTSSLTDPEASEETADEKKSWFNSMVDKVKDNVSDAVNSANKVLNNFIDTIAVFIITCCVIPLLVVFAGLWFIKVIFKLDMNISAPKRKKLSLYKNKKTITTEK